MSESVRHSKLVTIREVKNNTFIFEKKQALSIEFCKNVIERFERS